MIASVGVGECVCVYLPEKEKRSDFEFKMLTYRRGRSKRGKNETGGSREHGLRENEI